MALPENSNWITPQLIQGGLPNSNEDYEKLLNVGVTVFVNLMGKREYMSGKHAKKYNYRILPHKKDNIEYINVPITDLKILSDKEAIKLSTFITKRIKEGKTVYVHCLGGHGRSGTIVGLVLHQLFPEMTYLEIVEYLNKEHKTRKYKPNAHTPQTASQYNQLRRIIDKSTDIYFYEPTSPYYFLSNYYLDPKNPIVFKGKTWPSVENFYQYHKFVDTPLDREYAEILRTASTSNTAYLMGQIKIGRNGKVKLLGGRDNRAINNDRPDYKINDSFSKYSGVRLRKDWNEIQDTVMIMGIVLKFTQNEKLKKELIKTAPGKLHEFTSRDPHWATYWDGRGKNTLGKLLTKLRDCLIKHKI